MKYASKVVAQAQAWLGRKESDGSHKQIIDIYNGHTPLARGYKVKYTDPWCAPFVSAVAIVLGYTDIIPTECSCQRMIELCKKLGIWVEDENRTPAPGEIIFYDWGDSSAKGDNKGWADHVGIVETVKDGKITVIEGNYSNSVKRRTIEVNGRYIRGYVVPKYDEEKTADYTIPMRNLEKGCKGEDVRALQILLIGRGYDCGKYGADGDFGSATEKAVKACQKDNHLEQNGVAGRDTLGALLGV